MRLRSGSSIFFLVLLSLCSAAVAHAQAAKAELTGEIRDQNGASVTQARVVATEITTGQTYSAAATESGEYTITNLKPGTYSVGVEADNFKRFVQTGVRLATGERVRVDVVLQPGGLTETVTVSQDASLLRTETGSLGQVIRNRKIVRYPVEWPEFSFAGYVVGGRRAATANYSRAIVSSHQRRPSAHQ